MPLTGSETLSEMTSATLIVYARLPVAETESTTPTVKLAVPELVGVPEITPPLPSVSPWGNAPATMLKL